ncbi:pyridoxine 5'-phosphate synthase [Myxococcota bacterium]|nr:pyridoxine 5'-phosphate synthase [Myxococcota bacterium]
MTQLSVNLNKIALLRNSRPLDIPNVLRAAQTCIAAGAHGITVHPRPDERHIRRSDAFDLHQLLQHHPHIEFNIEGNPFVHAQTDERAPWFDLVRTLRPAQCTLVPDDPNASTSDHGWDLRTTSERLKPIVHLLREQGMRVSLFMDPDIEQIERAAALGVDRIELYTEPYAASFGQTTMGAQLETYASAAQRAHDLGLGVNAGHDLSLQNLGAFCSRVPHILEVSIGHALIADAIDMGLYATVQAYLKVLQGNSRPKLSPPPSRA